MPNTEKFTVSGSQVVDKVKQLIHEGNIRRVRILHEGRTLLELPLSIGAPATAMVILATPVLAALGAFAASIRPEDQYVHSQSSPCVEPVSIFPIFRNEKYNRSSHSCEKFGLIHPYRHPHERPDQSYEDPDNDHEQEIPVQFASNKVKFEIYGEEMIEKHVKLSGNSGRVYLPPNWVGHKVKIIRL